MIKTGEIYSILGVDTLLVRLYISKSTECRRAYQEHERT